MIGTKEDLGATVAIHVTDGGGSGAVLAGGHFEQQAAVTVEAVEAPAQVGHDDFRFAVSIEVGGHRHAVLAGGRIARKLPEALSFTVETVDGAGDVDCDDGRRAVVLEIGHNHRRFGGKIEGEGPDDTPALVEEDYLSGGKRDENQFRGFRVREGDRGADGGRSQWDGPLLAETRAAIGPGQNREQQARRNCRNQHAAAGPGCGDPGEQRGEDREDDLHGEAAHRFRMQQNLDAGDGHAGPGQPEERPTQQRLCLALAERQKEGEDRRGGNSEDPPRQWAAELANVGIVVDRVEGRET